MTPNPVLDILDKKQVCVSSFPSKEVHHTGTEVTSTLGAISCKFLEGHVERGLDNDTLLLTASKCMANSAMVWTEGARKVRVIISLNGYNTRRRPPTKACPQVDVQL